ncbi:MAG: ATP-binding protein, partial [bacterium]|nr:ATP-binding protein [bacterium]
MPKKPTKQSEYGAKDIMVLEGLDPVRKRPAMYIGSTGLDGLHHLVWEVLDNSIDEAMAGFARNIEVSLLPDERVQVVDDGRGIPVEKHPQTKKSTLETVMTILHAGGKFGGKAYQVSGGLHGVGVSVVNALSTYLKAEVCRDGMRYEQEYTRGKPKGQVKKVGACKGSGTRVLFEADPEIFKEIKYDAKRIVNHLRQQAYLTSGTKITFVDAREAQKKPYTFYFEGGLASYIPYLIKGRAVKHDNVFYVNGEKEGVVAEVAFQYTEEYEIMEESFANNIYTPE